MVLIQSGLANMVAWLWCCVSQCWPAWWRGCGVESVSVGQHGGVVVVLSQSVLASMVAWLWC